MTLRQMFTFLAVLIGLAAQPALAEGLLCGTFYDSSLYSELLAQENIGGLARIDGSEWFEIAIPHATENNVNFEYKKVQGWDAVKQAFEGVNTPEKQIAQDSLNKYVKQFGGIVRYFRAVSKDKSAQLKARIKNIDSLRNKIIDRAKEYLSDGKVFHTDLLTDYIGLRMVFDQGADILKPLQNQEAYSKAELIEYYTKELGLSDTVKIKDVDLKGGADSVKKKRYYRAVHLTIEFGRTPFELQLMSKSMAVWHMWDHPHVYKNPTTDAHYKDSLTVYSRFWVRMIRLLEDMQTSRVSVGKAEIEELLRAYRLDMDSSGFSKYSASVWLRKVDSYLVGALGIKPEDSFLGAQSVLTTTQKKMILKSLISQDIF